MSYLSRRSREIREEDQKRRTSGRVTAINVTLAPYRADGTLDYPRVMRMVDSSMIALQDRAFEQYEQTLLARNPHMREHINFRGRGA